LTGFNKGSRLRNRATAGHFSRYGTPASRSACVLALMPSWTLDRGHSLETALGKMVRSVIVPDYPAKAEVLAEARVLLAEGLADGGAS